MIVNNIATGVDELVKMGARRFLIVGPIDFSVIFGVIHSGDPNQPASSIDFQNQMDAKLTSRIDELRTQMDVEITYFDYVALSTKILSHPSDYGIADITNRCLVEAYVCETPDQYYIWDDYHPTRRVHDIFGKSMAALYGK
jgi:phospholipase/lecithinase/hemolysin